MMKYKESNKNPHKKNCIVKYKFVFNCSIHKNIRNKTNTQKTQNTECPHVLFAKHQNFNGMDENNYIVVKSHGCCTK